MLHTHLQILQQTLMSQMKRDELHYIGLQQKATKMWSNSTWIKDNKEDRFGKTMLYWAAQNGYKDVVQILLDGGADPNKANEDGRTPLY